MVLFYNSISTDELVKIKCTVIKIRRASLLVNTTVCPEEFFRNLNLLFDLLITLGRYEEYLAFKGILPQGSLLPTENLEKTVNDFTDRAFSDLSERLKKLKTDKAKENRINRFIVKMRFSFKNANNFLDARPGEEHYTGRLFTGGNIEYFNKKIRESGHMDTVLFP